MKPMVAQSIQSPALTAFVMGLSWLGMAIHNRVEFPEMPLLRPEYLLPAMLSLALLIAWWLQPAHRRLWSWFIFFWSGLHLIVGGILTIIPLAIWPFYPEQTIAHYMAHLAYSLLQLPILIILWPSLRPEFQS